MVGFISATLMGECSDRIIWTSFDFLKVSTVRRKGSEQKAGIMNSFMMSKEVYESPYAAERDKLQG